MLSDPFAAAVDAGHPLPDAALDQLFRTARTPTRYLDRPVTETTLRAIWELAKWGPTSVNSQPMRVIWCTSQAAKNKLATLTSGSNPEKVSSAPAVAIIGMDLDFPETLPRLFPHADARAWFAGNLALIEETAFRNSSLGGAYLMLAARALGLACGPMSGIDRHAIDEAFFAGTTVRTNFITTLGYADPAGGHARNPRLDFDEANRLA